MRLLEGEGRFVKVTPISVPNIDWGTLVSSLNSFGVHTFRQIDKESANQDYRSFLYILNPKKDITHAVRSAGMALNALSFSFYVEGPQSACVVLQSSSLTLHQLGRAEENFSGILSGTLFDWKHSLVELSSKTFDIEAQRIVCLCFMYFEQLNFRDIWADFEKVETGKGLFTLKLY